MESIQEVKKWSLTDKSYHEIYYKKKRQFILLKIAYKLERLVLSEKCWKIYKFFYIFIKINYKTHDFPEKLCFTKNLLLFMYNG